MPGKSPGKRQRDNTDQELLDHAEIDTNDTSASSGTAVEVTPNRHDVGVRPAHISISLVERSVSSVILDSANKLLSTERCTTSTYIIEKTQAGRAQFCAGTRETQAQKNWGG